MAKNNTRRNKTEGGKRRKNKTEGGKRKTRKMSKGASSWTKSVTELYRKMKKENPSTQFKDALVKASQLKKKGQL